MPKLAQEFLNWFASDDNALELDSINAIARKIKEILADAYYLLAYSELSSQVSNLQEGMSSQASGAANAASTIITSIGTIGKSVSANVKDIGIPGLAASQAIDILTGIGNLAVTLAKSNDGTATATSEQQELIIKLIASHMFMDLLKRYLEVNKASYCTFTGKLNDLLIQALNDFAQEAAILLYIRHMQLIATLTERGKQDLYNFFQDSIKYHVKNAQHTFAIGGEGPVACLLSTTFPNYDCPIFMTNELKKPVLKVLAGVNDLQYILRDYFYGAPRVIIDLASDGDLIYTMVVSNTAQAAKQDLNTAAATSCFGTITTKFKAATVASSIIYPAILLLPQEAPIDPNIEFTKEYGVMQLNPATKYLGVYLAYKTILITLSGFIKAIAELNHILIAEIIPEISQIGLLAINLQAIFKEALFTARFSQNIAAEMQVVAQAVHNIAQMLGDLSNKIIAEKLRVAANCTTTLKTALENIGPDVSEISLALRVHIAALRKALQSGAELQILDKYMDSLILQVQENAAIKKTIKKLAQQLSVQEPALLAIQSEMTQASGKTLVSLQKQQQQLQNSIAAAKAHQLALQDKLANILQQLQAKGQNVVQQSHDVAARPTSNDSVIPAAIAASRVQPLATIATTIANISTTVAADAQPAAVILTKLSATAAAGSQPEAAVILEDLSAAAAAAQPLAEQIAIVSTAAAAAALSVNEPSTTVAEIPMVMMQDLAESAQIAQTDHKDTVADLMQQIDNLVHAHRIKISKQLSLAQKDAQQNKFLAANAEIKLERLLATNLASFEQLELTQKQAEALRIAQTQTNNLRHLVQQLKVINYKSIGLPDLHVRSAQADNGIIIFAIIKLCNNLELYTYAITAIIADVFQKPPQHIAIINLDGYDPDCDSDNEETLSSFDLAKKRADLSRKATQAQQILSLYDAKIKRLTWKLDAKAQVAASIAAQQKPTITGAAASRAPAAAAATASAEEVRSLSLNQ